jgi:cyclin B
VGVTTRSRSANLSTSAALRSVSEATAGLPDIDAADRDDPLQAAEYINDILSWYRKAEAREVVDPQYMRNQTDVNDKMRAILIDWLVEVHLKFKLMPETLHLTVNVIDRFLARKQVTRKNLQLVGVTAMLVASKYEEIWAPEVRDFVYISDKAYTRDQILNTEKMMLNTLKFNMTVPTGYHFMNRFLKAAKADKKLEQVAMYLMEVTMPNYNFVKYPASHMAAATLRAAQLTLQRGTWNTALQKHSQYSEAQLRECVEAIVAEQAKAPTASLHAVQKKYSHHKFGEVAKLPAPIL